MKKKDEKASISIMKIICVSLILMFLSGIGVMAVTTQIDSVKITLSNGYEMTVLTSKMKVSEILEENNIMLTEDEKVIPGLEEELNENRTIKIISKTEQEIQIAKISENGTETTLDDILQNYSPIVEKVVVEQEEIPFETVTKNSTDETDTSNKVIRQGENGIKEVTYKVKIQNEIEIEKNKLSEQVIKEPVDKIVQVVKTTSRAATTTRTGVFKVTAYCSCPKCCGASANGITASGTRATQGRTVATSSQFTFGTKLVINGKQYVVEDRGGAIQGNRIDVYFESHAQAIAWGVRYLPVEVAK